MKLFQNLVNQFKEIVEYDFGITDEFGLTLASTDEKNIGQVNSLVAKVLQIRDNCLIMDGYTFQKIFIKGRLELILYINADSEDARKYLGLISILVSDIKEFHDEKYDKNSFIKNIVLDNILPGDIQFRAKELHLNYNSYRVAFLIRVENAKDIYIYDVIQNLFPNRTKDFILTIDDENTVLIKELKSSEDSKEVQKIAKTITDTLSTELIVKSHVGIGTIVDNLKDVARSYKEAQIALLVGGIFDNDKHIINYNNLGIGRLIYQLPTTLCKLFLKEVFKDGSFESLDQETLNTIQKFFENNLNVSETSRQLYVHRNTLVYRLDKIQKLTGLDLRKFDDAIIFKVAMLVKKYLDKGEN
jgi:Sugar diacid utilization regulator